MNENNPNNEEINTDTAEKESKTATEVENNTAATDNGKTSESNGGINDAKDEKIAGGTNIQNIENIEEVEITSGVSTSLLHYLPHLIIGSLATAVLIGIIYLLYTKGDFNSFISGDALATRGLITFLVAVVTITIAMILTISAVLSDAENSKERFAMGKEVLTILIGVLGTIVGFYFGADRTTTNPPSDPAATAATQRFQVIPLNLSSDQVTSDTSTLITAGISGGKPEYKYKIVFNTPALQTIEGVAPNGVIQAEVKKPATGFDKDTEVSYSIEATDAENRKAVLTGDKVKKFVVKNL